MNTQETIISARRLFSNELTYSLTGKQVCELALGTLRNVEDALNAEDDAVQAFITTDRDLLDMAPSRAASYWPSNV